MMYNLFNVLSLRVFSTVFLLLGIMRHLTIRLSPSSDITPEKVYTVFQNSINIAAAQIDNTYVGKSITSPLMIQGMKLYLSASYYPSRIAICY